MTAARSANDRELRELAVQLRAAECAGDLIAAFRVLRIPRHWRDAVQVLLHAGHSVGFRGASEFWRDAQRDVAQACRQRVDGFGLLSTPTTSTGVIDHD